MNDFYQPAPNLQNGVRNNFPPYTNILLVDSLEHALRMPARPHSEMIYMDRYKDVLYRIYTDDHYGKQYMTIGLVKPEIPEEKNPYEDRLSKIEKTLEVLINGKYDVKTDERSNELSATAEPTGSN